MEGIIMKLEELIAGTRCVQLDIAFIEDDSDKMNDAYRQTRVAIEALKKALDNVKEV